MQGYLQFAGESFVLGVNQMITVYENMKFHDDQDGWTKISDPSVHFFPSSSVSSPSWGSPKALPGDI